MARAHDATKDKRTEADEKKLNDAKQKGIPLTAEVEDLGKVTVEAVLLPERVCREVFGKEISQNYAAIELTISNNNRDAALIVQTLYIDYASWALSGPAGQLRGCSQGACTKPNQISSVEYRIARGELLDRQPWTFRNVTVRGLQALGSIATAYTFTLSGTNAVRSINAVTGQVIPALDNFWPDGTIGQMNRISDVGFKVNKVIPKESSDIVVAFFPIDRFLTPGFKKLFLKSAALFFAPGTIFLDRSAARLLQPDLQYLLGDAGKVKSVMQSVPRYFVMDAEVERLKEEIKQTGRQLDALTKQTESSASSVTADLKDATSQQLTILNDHLVKLLKTRQENPECDVDCAAVVGFLNSVSLNNVRIVAGGMLTVDVNTVAASIVSIDLDGGNDNPNSWAKGDHMGSIKGSYLQGATPVLVDAPEGLQIAAVQDGSSDTVLRFKLTVPDKFLTSSERTLKIKVTKKDKDGKTTDSSIYEMRVPAQAAPADTGEKK